MSLGPADHLEFTNSAFGAVTSGALLAPQPVVRVVDAGGNVITAINPITLSVTQPGATVTCTNNTVSTAASIAEFAGCSLSGLAGSYTLHGAIGSSGVTGTSGPVAVNTGVATHLVFTNTAFGSAINGVTLARQPRVAVEDAGGNIVTGANSITLSVTGAPGGVAVTCTTNPLAASSGIATFAGCNLTGPAATYTLHATNGAVTGDSGNIVLASFGTATHLVFTNSAFGTAVNGAPMTPQPQVTVEDAANNVVTSANSITLSVTGGVPTLACPTSTLTVAATLGVATFAGCNLTGTNATYTLHAAVGITSVTGVSGNVVLATGAVTHLVFTNTAFGAAINGAPLAPQPEVTAKDAGGNTVTTADSITLSVNEGGATVDCMTNPVAAASGIATFAGCNLIGAAATYTLHASDGTVAGDSGSIVLAASGAATQLVFTNSGFGAVVNGALLVPQPQVTVKDAIGNTVTSPRTIDLSVSSDGAALDCTDNSSITTAGVATFGGCDLVGTDATYTLHANSGTGAGALSGVSGNIVLGTGPAAQLVFTNTAFESAVNGDSLVPQPEVTVLDAGGNIVLTPNSITLTANELGGIVTCTTNPMPTTSGVAAFAGCNLSGAAGTYTLHADSGTVTGDSDGIALADFGPATHLVFTNGAFGAATNGAAFSSQPQVTVEDAANNVVTTADSITLSVNGGVPTLACPTSTLTKATTAGVATFAGCNLTGADATYTLHATNGTLSSNSGNVVLGSGPATHLVFTSAAFDPAVNGVDLSPQPVVTVEDVGGNTVTNATAITLLVTGTPVGVSVSCPGSTTTVSTIAGVATFSGCVVTGPAATYTLFATNTAVTGTSSNIVLAAFGAATHLVFTNTTFGAATNGASLAPQPQVTVEDGANNVVTTSSSITLSVNQVGASVGCTTNPMPTTAGVATFAGCNLTGTNATYTLHAAVGVTSVTGNSGNVVLGTGVATHLVFTNTAFGVAANGAAFAPQPVVTVEDAGGNTVTSPNSITLSVNEVGATLLCTANPLPTIVGVATFAGCNLTGADAHIHAARHQRHSDRRQRQHRARHRRRDPPRVHEHALHPSRERRSFGAATRGHRRRRRRQHRHDADGHHVVGQRRRGRGQLHDQPGRYPGRDRDLRRLQPHCPRRDIHAARHQRSGHRR